jgi:uncharacterized protein (DUF111 family)
MYSGSAAGELCTPTGAALLKHFVGKFCKMPIIAVDKHGYGMGKKDFDAANCVRAFLGEVDGQNEAIGEGIVETVVELACNLDDMSPEAVAFAQQLLLDEGALDVCTAPIGMKKGRPGLSFTCMCHPDIKDKMVSLIFKHTSTLGIKEATYRRHTMQREQVEANTKYGPVRVKNSFGYGTKKTKPEYDDVARIAREQGMSVQEVLKEMIEP